SALDAQGDVTLVADGDVTIQAQEYREFSRHETIKKGFGGLSSKQSVDATSKQALDASELLSAQNIVVKSGEDLQVLASDIVADGDVNLQALDEVLIAAGEMVTQSEQWTKESSFFSGGDLYSQSFDLQGEEHTTAAQSQVQSGGNLTVNAGSIKVVGSELGASENAALTADTGNVDILAARESHTTYEEHEKISISAGDVLTELMDTSNYTDSLESGQAKFKLAEATYDKVDTRTDETTYQGSSLVANSDVAIDAASDINIEGSTLVADANANQNGDLTLKAGDSVRITDVTNSRQTQTEETHGKAEVSVVVQHQAVEVAKAAQALQESTKALKQAKNDYRQYKKQLDTLNTTLSKLEQELAANKPGVTQADIIELKGLIADVKGDEEWYVSGIALAAVDVTAKTTALVQQTAAAAQSTATYGFNAGIQLDIEGSKTQTESRQTKSQASQLAGNNITIQAGNEKGNEAIIKGSHLAATDSLSIAANEVNLLAAQETSQSSSNNKTVSGSVQATAYGATSGISVSLNGSESESQSSSTTHINSTLTADNIAITSTGDTTVRGANVDAQSELALNVGGDLTVESVQDRHSSNNKSRGVSAGISLGGGKVDSNGVVDVAGSEGNVTGANGGLNASSGRTYQTDTVLTSLTAGETATIKVDGHTQINGALIATVDEDGKDAGNLTLET
ncbi:hemagglutinin repeat-containing protein, partial [Grimontia marina]|uniref:hemagglutinin repeat-containing protein n=1 Tax=Grimontia marina TaxID=646534 RepID=UPI0018DE6F5F